MDFETRAIHAGQEPDPATGAVTTPIYQTSTFAQEAVGVHKGYDYARVANPTRTALEECLASLEGAESGHAFSSGLGATTTVMHLVDPGQHVVCVNDVYGGTYRMFSQVYEPKGYRFTYLTPSELSDPDTLAATLDSDVALVWIETPTNPLLNIVDIPRSPRWRTCRGDARRRQHVRLARTCSSRSGSGADIVVHRTTKYLGGHSDVIGGFAATTTPTRGADRLPSEALGAVPGPFDAWLVLRGVKTLAVRMGRHCANARPSSSSPGHPGRARSLSRPARPPRTRGRGAADARLRRHGLVPPRGRAGGARRRAADGGLHAAEKPRRCREPDRAPRAMTHASTAEARSRRPAT